MCVHRNAPRRFAQPPGKWGGGDYAETSTAVISGFFIYYAAGYYIKSCFLLLLLPSLFYLLPPSSLFSCFLSQLLAPSLCWEDGVAPSCQGALIFPLKKTKEIVKNSRTLSVHGNLLFTSAADRHSPRARSSGHPLTHPPFKKNGRSHKIDWRYRCRRQGEGGRWGFIQVAPSAPAPRTSH